MTGRETFSELRAMAESPLTRKEELVALAGNPDRFIRLFVVKNPRTPEWILNALATDEHWSVRYAVAASLRTSKETLFRLALDADPRVRQGVDENKSLTKDDKQAIFRSRVDQGF